MLTSDDLDAIGHDALQTDDPEPLVIRLVQAVDQNGLADPADAGYALSLAAEIHERRGDLPAALALVERAVSAYPAGDDGYTRAYRAELLSRLGRDDEAMAEFSALRPRLLREAAAAAYLSEAMEECDRAPIAEQWLTSAMESLLDRDGELDERGADVIYALMRSRSRIRRELGLPPDEMDQNATRIRLAEYGLDSFEPEGPALLFWPRAEFDRVMLRWPALAGVYGRTWDEHRAQLEKALTEMGETGLALSPGAADGLATFAARQGADPADPVVCAGYAAQQENTAFGMPWPPGRNEPCWCGSGGKYKKCCLPRSRG